MGQIKGFKHAGTFRRIQEHMKRFTISYVSGDQMRCMLNALCIVENFAPYLKAVTIQTLLKTAQGFRAAGIIKGLLFGVGFPD